MVRMKQTARKNNNLHPTNLILGVIPSTFSSSSSFESSDSFESSEYETSSEDMSTQGCVLPIHSDSGDDSEYCYFEEDDVQPNQPQRSPTLVEMRVTIRQGRRVPPFYDSLAALNFIRDRPNRGFIVERQFNGIPGNYHHQFKLDILVDPPTFAKVSVVKEFYGHLSQTRGDEVYVRGIQIDLKKERWNEFLGMTKVEADYRAKLWSRFPAKFGGVISAIEEFLCEGYVFWNFNSKGEQTNFPFINLKDEWKGWFFFICSNLMPTKAKRIFPLKRALLLLAIQQEIPINIPKLLNEQMKYCVEGKGPKNWFFPRLITAFVLSQGVRIYDQDEDCIGSDPINQADFGIHTVSMMPGTSNNSIPIPRLKKSDFSEKEKYMMRQVRDAEVRTAARVQYLMEYITQGSDVPIGSIPPPIPQLMDDLED